MYDHAGHATGDDKNYRAFLRSIAILEIYDLITELF